MKYRGMAAKQKWEAFLALKYNIWQRVAVFMLHCIWGSYSHLYAKV